jgi:predicted nucleic acid-binding protein
VNRQVVIDASVLLRLVLDASVEAAEIVRRDELAAPGLIVPETANGLAKEVRFGDLEPEHAALLMAECLALPIELVPDSALSVDALAAAAQLALSAYDAAYVVLAARLDAPLVTADRRLAAAYPRVELIP